VNGVEGRPAMAGSLSVEKQNKNSEELKTNENTNLYGATSECGGRRMVTQL
jgi:hypothetical protein